jgi:hypothetical protein
LGGSMMNLIWDERHLDSVLLKSILRRQDHPAHPHISIAINRIATHITNQRNKTILALQGSTAKVGLASLQAFLSFSM